MNRDQFEAKRRQYLAPDPAQPILTEDGLLPVGPQETQSLECVGQKEARATADYTQLGARSPERCR